VAEDEGGRGPGGGVCPFLRRKLLAWLLRCFLDELHKTDADFVLLLQILVNTIRLEIASCAQRSYPSLSISSAKNLLFLDSEGAVVEFAKQQGWTLEEGRIYFPGLEAEKDVSGHEGDQKEVISNMIGYARDLEMIV
jgi:26S proteasome regulatory subunit N12